MNVHTSRDPSPTEAAFAIDVDKNPFQQTTQISDICRLFPNSTAFPPYSTLSKSSAETFIFAAWILPRSYYFQKPEPENQRAAVLFFLSRICLLKLNIKILSLTFLPSRLSALWTVPNTLLFVMKHLCYCSQHRVRCLPPRTPYL